MHRLMRDSRESCQAVLVFGLALVSATAAAHHALTAYDDESIVQIEGVVSRVHWRNPHIRIFVESEDGSTTYHVDGASVNLYDRIGFRGSPVDVGDRVAVFGNPSRRDENALGVSVIAVVDGPTYVLNEGRAEQFGLLEGLTDIVRGGDIPEVVVDPADFDVEGIFRVWTNVGNWNADVRAWWAREHPLTESARLEWEDRADETDSFEETVDNCVAAGMPEAMLNPFPIEFVDQGDSILLRIEEWDNRRTIQLNASLEADMPHSPLGHSVGYWEGSTLVVETDRINYPYLSDTGFPQSEAVSIVERFALSDGDTRLMWTATVTDPETFTEPVELPIIRYEWQPGSEVRPFGCDQIE